MIFRLSLILALFLAPLAMRDCGFAYGQQQTPIMMNVAAPYSWNLGASHTFNDLANQVRPYGSPAAPWDESIPVASYVGGYPVGDFGGYLDPVNPGTYTVSFKGAGTLTWSNVAASTPTSVTFKDGQPAWFSVIGTSRDTPFRDFHVWSSGADVTGGLPFAPEFLNELRGVACVRTMDWSRTNSATPATWAQRQTPAGTQTTMERGVCLEYQIALANALNADIYLDLYDFYGDEDFKKVAAKVAAELKPNLNVYIEISNETWNGQFPQLNRILTAAQNNPNLTATDRWERLGQHVAWTLVDAVQRFQEVMPPSRVRGVVAGQAANSWWAQVQLDFIEAKFGSPLLLKWVYAVALGDYWYVKDAPGANDAALFKDLSESIIVDAAKNLAAHKAVGARYGVNRLIAYEGGQHIYGAVNKDVHRAMQRDERMGALYKVGIDQFFAGGGTMWGAFCSTGPWVKDEVGFWNLNEYVGDDTPKRRAVRAYYATAIPPPVVPPVTPQPPPATQPTSQPSTRPSTQPVNLSSVTVEIGGATITISGVKVTGVAK